MPEKFNLKREVLEAKLKTYQKSPIFAQVAKKEHELLNLLGNVDGDEILALALIAYSEATGKEVI